MRRAKDAALCHPGAPQRRRRSRCTASVRPLRPLSESARCPVHGHRRAPAGIAGFTSHRSPRQVSSPQGCGSTCVLVCETHREQFLDNSGVPLSTVLSTARSTALADLIVIARSLRSERFLQLSTDPQDLLPLIYILIKYRSIRGRADRQTAVPITPPNRAHFGFRDKGISWSSGSSKPSS